MADLKIIAELTPPPHNACRLGFDARPPLWLGFQPNYREELGAGRIETISREHERHHFVTFTVESDEVLEKGRATVFRDWDAGRKINDHNYEARDYYLGIRDCVTFARDVAEACGLRTGAWYEHPIQKIDFLPYELLMRLRHFNEDRVVDSNLLSTGVTGPGP
jgi:hypothetical protein